MTVRRMVIVRAPGTQKNPMVRISNSFLVLAGFKIGTPIEISYQQSVITIKKLDSSYEHCNLPESLTATGTTEPTSTSDR